MTPDYQGRALALPAQALRPFWQQVDREGDCWLWLGATTTDGYGRFHVAGVEHLSHRLAYQRLVGAIPEGLQIDHLCKVRNCVNPSHLEPVTERENILRSDAPTAINARKTHCIHGHEFTPENTLWRGPQRTGRACRTCKREYERRYKPDWKARRANGINT